MSIAKPFDDVGRPVGFTDEGIRTAARHGVRLWATNILVAGFGFVTPLAFARLATPEDYGRFSFVAALLAMANALTLPGLTISLTQAIARKRHGALQSVAVTRLRWAMATALLVASGATAMLMGVGDRQTGVVLLAIAPMLPLIYGLDLAQPFLNGQQRFAALSLWMLIAAIAPSIVVVAVLALHRPLLSVFAYFAALALVNAVSLWWVWKHGRANDDDDPETIAYGKRLTVITSAGTLQAYVDRLAVGGILGLETLAVYSIGNLFQQAIKVTWGALHQLYFPKLASRNLQQARHLTRATLSYVMASFAVLAIVGIAAAPLIVHLLFGDRYHDSVPIARILMFGIFIAIPGAQFEILFRSTSDERRLYIQRITYAVCELTLVAAGSFVFGIRGAAWASVLANGVNSISGFVLDRRR